MRPFGGSFKNIQCFCPALLAGTASDRSDATVPDEQKSPCSPHSETRSADSRKRGSERSSAHSQPRSHHSDGTLGGAPEPSPRRYAAPNTDSAASLLIFLVSKQSTTQGSSQMFSAMVTLMEDLLKPSLWGALWSLWSCGGLRRLMEISDAYGFSSAANHLCCIPSYLPLAFVSSQRDCSSGESGTQNMLMRHRS